MTNTLQPPAHIHILGIAGHAMAGVAAAAKGRGFIVSGTDAGAYPPMSDWLTEQGITWYREPDVVHIDGVDLVVLGGGVAKDHPELVAAQIQGIPVQSYPELVSSLITADKRIVVTGTHGKTTTTSLIAWLLESAGLKPDYLIGIKPKNFESSVRLAGGEVAVLEGDEYRSSQLDTRSKFEHYQPTTAIITSIEHDHPDLFPDLKSVEERFTKLVQNLPSDGRLIYCDRTTNVRNIAEKSVAPAESYDGEQSDWRAEAVEFTAAGISFDLHHQQEKIGRFELALYGLHNVANATAALAAAIDTGAEVSALQKGATSFLGANRRFERLTKADANITVIDDYAHHPTEVAATLAAAKKHFSGRVIAFFQPHTYSRTAALLEEYRASFADADVAYVVDIEGAREAGAAQNVSATDIATESNAHYVASRDELLAAIKAEAKPGDAVICMSVNGYEDVAGELSKILN